MDDVPDMDNLLDEMEADLIGQTRANQPPPPPLPVSITSSENGVITIKKVLPSAVFNENMQGMTRIDTRELPVTFRPEPIINKIQEISQVQEVKPEIVEKEMKTNGNLQTVEQVDQELPILSETVLPSEPDPVTDVEYEEALDYLNGFEDQAETEKSTNCVVEPENSVENPEFVRETAGKVAEIIMNEISNDLGALIIEEFSKTNVTSENITKELEEVEIEESEIEEKEEEKEKEEEIIEQSKNLSNDHEEPETTSEEEIQTVIEIVVPNQEILVENSSLLSDDSPAVEVVETKTDEEGEEEKREEEEDVDDVTVSRPRFDSSIATVHVLHESDSDEAPTPRRERRLTESELQLGKTSPYWIPDADCTVCMLCSTKFTIITRRHHCRACGRVLCGNCCSEKAILEYLIEFGKKPQPARVCQPCSSMLARIEAHEQEGSYNQENGEENRRMGVDEGTTTQSNTVPKGVLKTRNPQPQQSENEDTASTSTQSTNSSIVSEGTSSKRSVVFRDGVRPGAHTEETEQLESKSTALKPKKKSRKRHSVVRRCAELRMEDELATALPNEERRTWLTLNPIDSQVIVVSTSSIWKTIKTQKTAIVVLKKNLNCVLKVVEDEKFGMTWSISTYGFVQIGLDELFFAWKMKEEEIKALNDIENEESEENGWKYMPLAALERISIMYENSTESEYAGVRRVESRFSRLHSVQTTSQPISKHILLFRPTVQCFERYSTPKSPFLVACFLLDSELQWATACPNRLLNRLGLKYGCFPTPIVNDTMRDQVYSDETMGTVLKVFTDFRSWSYRMRHISGCTVSLTNETTTIRIPRSVLAELKEVISLNRSMLSWICDFSVDDDSVLICDETDPGLYNTQVLTRFDEQRKSTGATFVVLDGGSKVNSLQVNVIEDGVSIRVQSDRLETILSTIQQGNDFVEKTNEMEFKVEFVEDEDIKLGEYCPKSMIDGANLMNKYQYGLSLERALTQVLQVQGISDYGVRLSHVYNLREGRLCPEDEPKIYGMAEIAAKECVAMLEPFIKMLIATNIENVAIRLMVSMENIEYDVSKWTELEEENERFKQSLDQLIPLLYNMTEYVPNGFSIELVLSIISTRPLPI